MKIIAIVNAKGGSGRTTTTINLATYITSLGQKVGIVDTDPTEALSQWHARRMANNGPDNPELLKGVNTVADAVEAVRMAYHGDWQYLFIDTAPGDFDEVDAAIKAADFVLIPVRPSALDLSATEIAIDAVNEYGKPHLTFLNAVLSDGLEPSTREYLIAAGASVATAKIRSRKPCVTCMIHGMGIAEFKGGSRQSRNDAYSDIHELWEEIQNTMTVERTA